MFQYKVLTLFLCVTSVLTSLPSNETKIDIPSKFPEFTHAMSKPLTEKEVPISYAVNTTQGIVTEIERPIIVAKGVRLSPEKRITSSREGVTNDRKADPFVGKSVDFEVKVTPKKETESTSYVQDNNNSDSISDFRKGITKERNANPSVVPRKGVDSEINVTSKEKIELPSYVSDSKTYSVSNKHLTNINDFKTSLDLSTVSTISSTDNQKLNVTDSTSGINSTIAHLDLSTNVDNVTTPTSELVLGDKRSNDTASISIQPHKKHKSKPTVTIGEYDDDKPIPALPTKNTPLGIPRKIDYIVPVMITIMAVPLLGVAAFVLYRRGKDCWDKRHYRRMDFLIDGMYND